MVRITIQSVSADNMIIFSSTPRQQSYTFNPIRTQYSEKHFLLDLTIQTQTEENSGQTRVLAPGGRGPRYEWKGI